MNSNLEEYLQQLNRDLRRCFWIGKNRRRRILLETEDHLLEAAQRETENGEHGPQQRAIAKFGASNEVVEAFAETNKRRLLAALGLSTGGVSGITALMSAGVVVHTLRTLADPWLVISVNLLLAGFIVVQGTATIVHLVSGIGRERVLFLGAIVLFGLGLFVTVKSSYNAWTGPDPEYWVVMLGLLVTTQATGTLLRVGQWEWRRNLGCPHTGSSS